MKPPYQVPTMDEIAEIRGKNGLTVISTFSGCGGSCLGFEMAGYDVRVASEFVELARRTYEANHPGVPVIDRDIRETTGAELLELAGIDAVDVLEGSPPCASFSTAGARSRLWGQKHDYSGKKQATDDLFGEYARLLDELRPRAFVAENVSGLVKGVSKGYFREIHAELTGKGYRVEARLLDSQWLGVPQARQRLIFVGVRDDLGVDPPFPTPLPYRYSIRDALPWIDDPGEYVIARGRRTMSLSEPVPTVQTHGNFDTFSELSLPADGQITHDPETGHPITLEGTAIAPEYDKLAEGESSERYFNLVRPSRGRPAPTITQAAGGRGTAGITHPTQRRKFTLLELRRLSSFPDDFELVGTYAQRWERLGRAVPPLMMKAVADALLPVLT